MKSTIPWITLLIICLFPISDIVGQENVWSETYESREEFNDLVELVTTNLVLSGQTHELGNKSDIVILTDANGKELKRVILCESCPVGEVVESIETSSGEVLHFRSNGDFYSSDLNLDETNFEYNISEGLFESIETYQILKYNHFLIAVSYAVQDDIKGLLHTVMDSRDKRLYSQKFNVEFPDIAGSVGIGIFDDQGVVDGYNTEVGGQSMGHLVRLGRFRDIVWEVDLDFGDITLAQPMVSRNQQVYAVGSIVDEDNPNHTQGLIASYDQEGQLLWTQKIDAQGVDDSNLEMASIHFENIEQLSDNEFVITGREGGRAGGDDFSSALVMVVDGEGNIMRRYSSALLSTTVDATDVVLTRAGELVYVARSFKNNSIIGSYVSGTERTSSVKELDRVNSSFVYPNPAAESVFINPEITHGTYEVIDMGGRVVLSGAISGPSISVAEIEKGMYILKLQVEDESTRLMKLMKL